MKFNTLKVCFVLVPTLLSMFVFAGIFVTPAFAYIDPGTGATFIGSMAPLVVGVATGFFAFLVKVFWHPLKRIFSRQKPDSVDS